MLALVSCAGRWEPYVSGPVGERRELRELFGMLDRTAGGSDAGSHAARFALSRKIASILAGQGRYGHLATLLPAISARFGGQGDPQLRSGSPILPRSDDPYVAWYLFGAALAYERMDSGPVADMYYDRILRNAPDLVVENESIHFQCLERLLESTEAPEIRIGYYNDLAERFPDRTDPGRTLFLLGKEYEKTGAWDRAVRAYRDYLYHGGTTVPGFPDSIGYARNLVDLYNSPRDWTNPDLAQLVSGIRAALASGSAKRLGEYRAKVGFFAESWHRENEIDRTDRGLSDFSAFMRAGAIRTDANLDRTSGTREAFLRTRGWSGYQPTWYFYFRRMNFPADPEIHGNWEWAGIYFGEKPQ